MNASSIREEDATSRWLRAALGMATLLMLGLSWPLWVGEREIPWVPFLSGMNPLGGPFTRGAYLGLLLSVGLFAIRSRGWRLGFFISLAFLCGLILGDQHRFQPWAYQYAMTGLFLAAMPRGQGVRLARFWFVLLYLHSGLSKLDVSFRDELGLRFVATLLRPIGLEPTQWPLLARTVVVLGLPVGELAVACLLLSKRFCRVGLLGATVMHLTLILVLGPFGLDHGPIVLHWNLALLIQVGIVFWEPPRLDRTSQGGVARLLRGLLVRFLFLGGALLPIGERWGYFDPWPSHALYASHVDRMFLDLHVSGFSTYPESLRAHCLPVGAEPWMRLNLTSWSRRTRGTPVYPGNRAALGLAEGLAARYVEGGPVRVILFGPADRWTGHRSRTEIIGLPAIRRQADRYRINAHPARTPESSGKPRGLSPRDPLSGTSPPPRSEPKIEKASVPDAAPASQWPLVSSDGAAGPVWRR